MGLIRNDATYQHKRVVPEEEGVMVPGRPPTLASCMSPEIYSLPSNYPRAVDIEDSLRAIRTILDSGFTDTTVLDALRAMVSKRLGRKHVVILSNCSAACHAALWALGLGKGDEVICPALSDYATVFGILACGATPVFADVEMQNGLISASNIVEKITARTRAILVVHFWGITCDMAPILRVGKNEGIPVIEDCCQAPFANYRGKLTGSLGDISVFSFSKEKHWSADCGGLLVTDDSEVAAQVERFAIARGAIWEEGFGRRHEAVGFNYRPSLLASAVALAQLPHLDSLLDRRRQIIASLNSRLSCIQGLRLPEVPEGGDNVAWIYHFRVIDRPYENLPAIVRDLRARGLKDVDMAQYYYLPESCRGPLAAAGVRTTISSQDICPNAHCYLQRTMRWMLTEKYTEMDVDNIASIVKEGLCMSERS